MLSLTCSPMYLSSSFPPERAAGFWVYCNDRFQRGVKRKPMASIKKLREAMLSLTCPPMYLSSSSPPERAAGFWVYGNDRFQRGVKRKPMASIKKLRKACYHVFISHYGMCFLLYLLFVFMKFALQLQS
ncbi:hypothetical protein NC651_012695 [Populus alba x Populus x berolinensis]|nr:hypothetical protein NC651_012695 [Populus alba x Populus x berolinensis]